MSTFQRSARMSHVRNAAVVMTMLAAFSIPCCAITADAPPAPVLSDIPVDLHVEGTPMAVVHATGSQVYTCTADAAGKLAWTLKAPDAQFENAAGLMGTHYAGPTWAAADGSKVVGRKLKDHASPSGDAVAWLLLEAASHEGSGKLSDVTFIQRIHTVGGLAPTIGNSKAGDEVRVHYSADYVFYGPDASTQPANAR